MSYNYNILYKVARYRLDCISCCDMQNYCYAVLNGSNLKELT